MSFIIVCISSFIAALLTLFSGFGLGSLLLPAFAVFFPMQVAVAAVAVVHLANNLFKLLLVGRYADLRAAALFAVPGIAAAAGGALVLKLLADLEPLWTYSIGSRSFSVRPVDLAIGLLMVAFAFIEVLPLIGKMAFDRRYLPVGGLISGFFGGLSGHQGAFRSAFLVKSGLSPEAFLGTGVVCAVVIDVTRLSVYFQMKGLEALSAHDSTHDSGNAGLLVAAAIASAFAGSFLGARLFRKVTFRGIQRIVGAMLVLLGLAIAAGLTSSS
jgi:uncharacterized membrane protein YfcA